MSENSLSVTDLSVRFGGIHAVQGVSLDAPVGRLTALIGPNGAGKTTTFNALCGLNKPSSGAIELFGEDISHLSPPARSAAGSRPHVPADGAVRLPDRAGQRGPRPGGRHGRLQAAGATC